jgi:hypothetical protein
MAASYSNEDAALAELFAELQSMQTEGQDVPDWLLNAGSPMVISRRTTRVLVPGAQQSTDADMQAASDNLVSRCRGRNSTRVSSVVPSTSPLHNMACMPAWPSSAHAGWTLGQLP